MNDFLKFDKFLTPSLIQIVFWVGTASMAIPSLMILPHSFLSGAIGIVAAPVFMRVMCEIILVLFRINDALQEIKEKK